MRKKRKPRKERKRSRLNRKKIGKACDINEHGYLINEYGVLWHRIICRQFNGDYPVLWDVHHVDGDKLNNRPTNLIALPHDMHFTIHKIGLPDRNVLQGWVDEYKKSFRRLDIEFFRKMRGEENSDEPVFDKPLDDKVLDVKVRKVRTFHKEDTYMRFPAGKGLLGYNPRFKAGQNSTSQYEYIKGPKTGEDFVPRVIKRKTDHP